jgi:hypothetical protein
MRYSHLFYQAPVMSQYISSITNTLLEIFQEPLLPSLLSFTYQKVIGSNMLVEYMAQEIYY